MTDLKDFRWFEGKESESAFSKPFFSWDEFQRSNEEMPEFYRRIEQSGDDRSYVILTAIVLENQYDAFLQILVPGFKALRDSKGFGFSLKIELLRAFRLIPPLIPRCADCVRQIRNDFAHRLEIDKIERINPEHIDRAKRLYNEVYAPYVQTNDGKSPREVFHGVAFGALHGLRSYRPNVVALRQQIDDPRFTEDLRKVTDGAFFETLKALDKKRT